MNSVKATRPNWSKYVSRILLVAIAVVFLGCDEGESCEGGPEVCGEEIQIKKGFGAERVLLTDSNPTLRVITDDACALGGSAQYYVYYQYHDIPIIPGTFTHTENATTHSSSSSSSPPTRQATEKDKPSVIVKIGTLEKGAQSDPDAKKPGFVNGEWAVSGYAFPPKVKEGTNPAPIHYVLSVTMQRPLIKLPGNAATIALPFIGPIIGPKPRDVDVQLILTYPKPMAKK